MNQMMQRLALMSFLGCLAVIAIASGSKPRSGCAGEWKAVLKKTEMTEGLEEGHMHRSPYDLTSPAKIYFNLID